MTTYGAAELAASFRIVRKNTVQIAEEIPEDKYGFAPMPGWRSVADLLKHIAWAPMLYEDLHRVRRLSTFKGYDFTAMFAKRLEKERAPLNKEHIVALLRSEGERIAAWLGSLDQTFLNETFTDVMGQNPKTRFENMLAIKEHEMHHRGQLMLIQRMIGLVPHLTREREDRARQRAMAVAAAMSGKSGGGAIH
jgi:uncharacterized damage-inducible protein DinB